MNRLPDMRTDSDETLQSALRIRKACKVLFLLSLVLLVVAAVLTGFILYAFLHILQVAAYDYPSVLSSSSSLIGSLLVLLLLVLCTLLFRDLSKGLPPFSRRQAKRLRVAAYGVLAFGILQMLASPELHQLLGTFEAPVVYDSPSNRFVQANIQIWPFFVSFFVWALAYVFEYGILIQDLSDNTV